jgi:hypothetical protein
MPTQVEPTEAVAITTDLPENITTTTVSLLMTITMRMKMGIWIVRMISRITHNEENLVKEIQQVVSLQIAKLVSPLKKLLSNL